MHAIPKETAMRNRRSFRNLALAWVALILLPSHGLAGVNHRFVEDFSTTIYRDGIVTTADWDTVAGELRLPRFSVSIVGWWNSSDFSYDVAVAGDIAYVADGGSGLQVINITDPTHPARIATLDTPGTASGIAVAGNYAYIADGATVRVIDIHNPASPTAAGSVSITGGTARNIALSGDYAYVAAAAAGLVVLNITHPSTPAIAGTYDTPGSANDVALDGDYAYVVDSSSGVTALSISDPTHPAGIWAMDTPGSARGIAVAGDYAYVADFNGGLQVFDISDRTDPQIPASLSLSGYAYGAAVDGDRLYIAAGMAGVHTIDITNPTTPVLRETCDTPGDARALSMAGHHAFVTDRQYGLQVLEVNEDVPLEPATLFPTTYTPLKIKITGDYLFTTNAYQGLLVVDLSDPDNLVPAGSCDTGYAGGLDVAGDYVYLADHEYGLRVIDIRDQHSPLLVATLDTPGNAYDVTVDGDYAYVGDQASGVQVVNIADPLHPVIVGHFATTDWAWTVAIDGDYAFVAEYGAGMRVLDITNPANPISVGLCDTPGSVTDVVVAGDYAYLAGSPPGLFVMSISNPASPSIAGTCNLSTTGRSVRVQGNRAYVTTYAGLSVVDITDPAHPVLVDSYDPPNSGYTYGIAVAGDYAYLGLSSDNAILPVKIVSVDCLMSQRNLAQSLPFSSPGLDVAKAKLATMQTGPIDWSIRADAEAQWQAIVPDDSWQPMASPGSELVWRCTLGLTDPYTGGVCTQLGIDWLYEPAVIDSIRDIANDQGGRVRIRFARSSHDFANEAVPIVGYNVWRRVDDSALLRQVAVAVDHGGLRRPGEAPTPSGCGLDNLPLIPVGQRWFLPEGRGGETRSFPPGTWEVLGGFWATQQDQYIYEASTLSDSAAAVFCISAHTDVPSVWFVSPPDSGRSVDNIAPHVPTGFRVVHAVDHNALEWNACPDADFEYFRIYRDTSPDFVPAPENLIHMTIDTSWQDVVENGWQYYYKLTAVDHAGNESGAASAEAMGVADPAPVRALVLHRNMPNPFRPPITISFETPVRGLGKLAIYDARGRLVRVLLDRAVPAGRTAVSWDGLDAAGREVPSGAYFLRLEADGRNQTEGMTLVR